MVHVAWPILKRHACLEADAQNIFQKNIETKLFWMKTALLFIGGEIIKDSLQRMVLSLTIGLLYRIICLVVEYQAHINVESCNKTRLIKYLFKYINKGPDRARAILEDNYSNANCNSDDQYRQIDEIKRYLDCRYLSAYEAIWRLFQFDIHYREPTVERLIVHLPLMNNVAYHGSQSLLEVKST